VSFTSTASDPDGQIVSQTWDLDGDAVFDEGSGPTASHRFAASGSHEVKMRLEDSQGIEIFIALPVRVFRPPVAGFDFAPAAPVPDAPVDFTSSSSDADGQVVAQAWDLDGDGSFDDGTGASASRSFPAGTHTVRLRVTDSQGLADVAAHDVTVAAPPPPGPGPGPGAGPAGQVNRPPSARITWSPQTVHVGDTVSLNSGSSDPDGGILLEDWDLNGDGAFGDAAGPTATTSFLTSGPHLVAVRVGDDQGASVVVFETVTVLPLAIGPPPESRLQWLTPFPVVRVAGTAQRKFTRVRLLTVLTPAGSRVGTTCRGRGCPRNGFKRLAKGNLPVVLVHVRKFERRLRVGTVLGVSATKGDVVGKYTRLRMRALKPPVRVDRCVVPGRARPRSCPPRS
jgi:hypothetical protein